jgi:hypothetical protein
MRKALTRLAAAVAFASLFLAGAGCTGSLRGPEPVTGPEAPSVGEEAFPGERAVVEEEPGLGEERGTEPIVEEEPAADVDRGPVVEEDESLLPKKEEQETFLPGTVFEEELELPVVDEDL